MLLRHGRIARAATGGVLVRRRTRHRRHCSDCKERWGKWTMVCPRCGKQTVVKKLLIAAGVFVLAIVFLKMLEVF